MTVKRRHSVRDEQQRKRGYPAVKRRKLARNGKNDRPMNNNNPNKHRDGRLRSTAWLASTYPTRESTEATCKQNNTNNQSHQNNSRSSSKDKSSSSNNNNNNNNNNNEAPKKAVVVARVVSPVETQAIQDEDNKNSNNSKSNISSSNTNNKAQEDSEDVTMEKVDEIETDDEWLMTLSLLAQDDNVEAPDTNTTNNNKDDASSWTTGELFFLREPFTREEFQHVEGVVQAQVTKSMDVLERDGYQVFRDWKTRKEETSVKSLQTEQTRMEEAIQEAKIHGSPRDYQQRLFEIACQRNTIIHLGTGQGKTLIALMCIRHFAASFAKGKQTLFLVPSVALAVQQGTVLRANLPYSVEVACYATSTNAKARKALQESNVIVATHGTVRTVL